MTDKEIFELIYDTRTKERGFSVLVKMMQEKVYWQIRRMVLNHDDANDLTQEVFIKVYQGIESFKKDSSLYTWIYRIALNHSLNFLQAQKRKYALRFTSLEKVMVNNLRADNLFDADEIEYKFQKALLTLPEKQRMVFNLRYYDEMPFAQMAEVLNTSEGGLKASYHIAAKKVEEQLLKDENVKINIVD